MAPNRRNGDPLPHTGRGNRVTDGDNGSGYFVAKDKRSVDDEITDPAMAEIVHVRAADAHGRYFYEHFIRSVGGKPALLSGDGLGAFQNARAHELRKVRRRHA